jgi:hypothetical protein
MDSQWLQTMPKKTRKRRAGSDAAQGHGRQKPLLLAPLTPEEALKRMLGGSTRETRPEGMVPRAKPKSPKK